MHKVLLVVGCLIPCFSINALQGELNVKPSLTIQIPRTPSPEPLQEPSPTICHASLLLPSRIRDQHKAEAYQKSRELNRSKHEKTPRQRFLENKKIASSSRREELDQNKITKTSLLADKGAFLIGTGPFAAFFWIISKIRS